MKNVKKLMPQDVSDVKKLMVPLEDIPDEFTGLGGKWNEIVGTWFFKGLTKETKFYPKPDIDTQKALKHIGAILRSFKPHHEHKEACCAYLLSLWFEDVIL